MERFWCCLAGFGIALALVGIFTLVKSWWEEEYETLVGRVETETTIMVYEQVKNAEERIVSRLAEKKEEGEHEVDCQGKGDFRDTPV